MNEVGRALNSSLDREVAEHGLLLINFKVEFANIMAFPNTVLRVDGEIEERSKAGMAKCASKTTGTNTRVDSPRKRFRIL